MCHCTDINACNKTMYCYAIMNPYAMPMSWPIWSSQNINISHHIISGPGHKVQVRQGSQWGMNDHCLNSMVSGKANCYSKHSFKINYMIDIRWNLLWLWNIEFSNRLHYQYQKSISKLRFDFKQTKSSGDRWQHTSGSTLTQVMACCLRHLAIT